MLAVAAGGLALLLSACGGGDQELPPDLAGGERVFEAEGCGSCHALEAAGADGGIGPDLDEALKGRDQEFIRTSIVDPDAVVAEGFPRSVMPGNYEERLSAMGLDQLVEFLFQTAARE